jgi:dTDP-4-dehydrorhamnose reductase
LQAGHKNYGIYHFSNTGIISWYEFAEAIKSLSGLNCTVLPIPSSAYPTPAKRPVYSAMELNKISEDFGINLTDWQVGLKHCIKKISAT